MKKTPTNEELIKSDDIVENKESPTGDIMLTVENQLMALLAPYVSASYSTKAGVAAALVILVDPTGRSNSRILITPEPDGNDDNEDKAKEKARLSSILHIHSELCEIKGLMVEQIKSAIK